MRHHRLRNGCLHFNVATLAHFDTILFQEKHYYLNIFSLESEIALKKIKGIVANGAHVIFYQPVALTISVKPNRQ
jgi:hypothetical protein